MEELRDRAVVHPCPNMTDTFPLMGSGMRIKHDDLMTSAYFLRDQITSGPTLSRSHATKQQPWILQEVL
jgi:hypothetical protein